MSDPNVKETNAAKDLDKNDENVSTHLEHQPSVGEAAQTVTVDLDPSSESKKRKIGADDDSAEPEVSSSVAVKKPKLGVNRSPMESSHHEDDKEATEEAITAPILSSHHDDDKEAPEKASKQGVSHSKSESSSLARKDDTIMETELTKSPQKETLKIQTATKKSPLEANGSKTKSSEPLSNEETELSEKDAAVAVDANGSETSDQQSSADEALGTEIVGKYIELTPLPSKLISLRPLSNSERKELENYLEFGRDDDEWREDWIGNLAYADKDVGNPDGKSRDKQKKALFRWAERGKTSLRVLNNLLRLVFHLRETPKQAKKVLASADPKSVRSIQGAVRRVFYDPIVLQQDGWTTAKSSAPVGASGGPFRIGEMVFWQGFEGVVVAYIHDHDLGDLWKAMWLEEFDTFDLEAEELDDARKKYERKQKQKEQAVANPGNLIKKASTLSSTSKQGMSTDSSLTRRSGRYASGDFTVTGIEHGIVLAVSYSRGSRPGVFWPARVMHFGEMKAYGSQNKRGSQKQKVDVVFLAPYWNAAPSVSGSRRTESYSESLSRHGSSIFSSGLLFELESIDASEESIQEYPYDADRGLDLDQLRVSFKFAGLPKAAFSRFVDSHRLALGLRTYSQKVMKSTAATDLERTTAGLFEAHPLSAQTASFPTALLHLPFEHILSQLPSPERDSSNMTFDDSKSNEEPALQLEVILDSMKPPACWGLGQNVTTGGGPSPKTSTRAAPFASPPISLGTSASPVTVDRFISGLPSLESLLSKPDDESSMSALLGKNLSQLLSNVPSNASEFRSLPINVKRDRSMALVKLWTVVKTHGEELISSYNLGTSEPFLIDWRRACERIYKYITLAFSSDGFGNGVSWVLTDSLCNLHLTSSECFERAIRLPAALKAAKEAGAGKSDSIQLMTAVKGKYLDLAEKNVIRRAHKKTYLQRIKKKCMSVSNEKEVVSLTEDSDGNGGQDTKGTKGSWKAAIAGVGAAVQAVDMIMNGECVNVFCLTRPPGHHAGRELHAMKAVSNGFCLLNAAACAALYATSPVSEGGPGLRRVCVIDIDVHHGNGTQDILCSTYDPRFFYVSIHAGGPDINGVAVVEDEEQLSHHLGRNPKKGVFPGRCGDTSPHEGVLNIPLGAKVTSHALGTALVTKVTPAVEKFAPELIIVSAGFDAHKNDPLGLGGLCADDFGTLTEVICKLAHKSCSGRVLSILEGGYGVPCCRPQPNLFDPEEAKKRAEESKTEKLPDPEQPSNEEKDTGSSVKPEPAQKQLPILDLGEELPSDMNDEMPYPLQKRLDKCHAEGFIQCVREHVRTLAKCNVRS